MKSTHRFKRHMNTCTSQQVFPIYIQPKQNTLIPGENYNTSENFKPHEDKELNQEE